MCLSCVWRTGTFHCKLSTERPAPNLNWSMTTHSLNHQCLVFKVFSLLADVFNLFFIYSKIESKRSIFWGWELCACVCVCVCVSVVTSKQAYLATENSTTRRGKKGPHSYRLSQKKYRWGRHVFSNFCLFCLYFKKSFRLPYEGMPLSQFQNIWLALAWLHCFHPPLPPPPAAALGPSGPAPQCGSVQ